MAKTQKDKIKNFPVPDSIATEPFESIVELYYQTQGYITSSNKWFKFQKKGKRPGSLDIDVLAISKDETLIVAVTVNLDDKVGNLQKMKKLFQYFKCAQQYLENVPRYKWLAKNPRKILAYECGYSEATIQKKRKILDKQKIVLLSSDTIVENLLQYVRKTQNEFRGQNLKTNNPLVMLVRMFLPLLENKISKTSN